MFTLIATLPFIALVAVGSIIITVVDAFERRVEANELAKREQELNAQTTLGKM